MKTIELKKNGFLWAIADMGGWDEYEYKNNICRFVVCVLRGILLASLLLFVAVEFFISLFHLFEDITMYFRTGFDIDKSHWATQIIIMLIGLLGGTFLFMCISRFFMISYHWVSDTRHARIFSFIGSWKDRFKQRFCYRVVGVTKEKVKNEIVQ